MLVIKENQLTEKQEKALRQGQIISMVVDVKLDHIITKDEKSNYYCIVEMPE